MSLSRSMPYEEIPFDLARNKKTKGSPKKIEQNDLE
jgi:hypothetical protein